jgi:REP element-mobilizing transposase RayT
MARPWRIEYEGAFYHLLSRGNEKRDIFIDDDDRRMFLETLGEMAERFAIDIFAYVLMNNHYHLLIRTQRANLTKAMHWFGVTYTTRFNYQHSRSGHLFQGRYKSILVQNDAYMMLLSCYIHRNPLRSGIVKRLADYPWSSYRAYAYGRKVPAWLSTELILSQFGGEGKAQHRSYREKVQRYSKEEKQLWEDFRHGCFLGSKKFVAQIRKSHLPENPHDEIPGQKQIADRIDPHIILRKAAEMLNCDLKRLTRSGRLSGLEKDQRDAIIYLIWKTGRLTNARIGALFGVSYSSVSHSVKSAKKKIDKDPKLRSIFNIANSQFKI